MKIPQNNKQNNWYLSGVIILAISVISYLPFVKEMGFYTDDWYVIWGGSQRGLAQIIQLYFSDRPFMGIPFAGTFELLGTNPLVWHIYACTQRFLGGLIFLWILRQIWPNQSRLTFFTACLFAVYPGFLSQPKAVTYQLNIVALNFGLLSLGLTIFSLRLKKQFSILITTIIGVSFALLCYLMFEYMIGLEGVRVVILVLYIVANSGFSIWKITIKKAMLLFIPYFIFIGSFMVWRVFFFSSARAATDISQIKVLLLNNPFQFGLNILVESVKDFILTTTFAWSVPLYNLTEKMPTLQFIVIIMIAFVGGSLLILYLHLTPEKESGDIFSGKYILGNSLILGGSGIFFSLLPVWLAGRNVYFSDAYDHYSLQAAPFICLFVVAIISKILVTKIQNWVLVGLTIFGIITHVANGANYAKAWEYQRQLWWQLSWRAPNFKDNSVIIPILPPGYSLREGYEVWSPANIIYNRGKPELRVIGATVDSDVLLQILRSETYGEWFRGIDYTVQTSNSLVVSLPGGESCLHVLSGESGEYSDNESSTARLLAPFSKDSVIDINAIPVRPLESIFGKEPTQGWCYYYQLANLARQKEDWVTLTSLGDMVEEFGLRPTDPSEWIPFYIGYAKVGNIEKANVIGAILRTDAAFISSFCSAQQKPTYQNSRDEYIIINLCGALTELPHDLSYFREIRWLKFNVTLERN